MQGCVHWLQQAPTQELSCSNGHYRDDKQAQSWIIYALRELPITADVFTQAKEYIKVSVPEYLNTFLVLLYLYLCTFRHALRQKYLSTLHKYTDRF